MLFKILLYTFLLKSTLFRWLVTYNQLLNTSPVHYMCNISAIKVINFRPISQILAALPNHLVHTECARKPAFGFPKDRFNRHDSSQLQADLPANRSDLWFRSALRAGSTDSVKRSDSKERVVH